MSAAEHWKREALRAEIEVERLRSVLQAIADRPFTASLDAREMRDQARAALAVDED